MIMANNSSGSGAASAVCPPGLVGGGGGATGVGTISGGGAGAASSVAAALNSTNSDLWKECVLWLQRCKVIPPDHVATEEIRSLALTLRDGVMLCNLVIFLDPKCLDPSEMTKRPQMAQFLCCKNIKLFIDVCRNHFKLREADLFEPSMLYDLTHFHRVLITLSKLSQCAKVQKLHPNIVGFNLQLSPSERSHSDEAIYKDLHSTGEMYKNGSLDNTSSENYDHTSQSGSLSVEDENSDITIENEMGTENTEDYEDDNFSALSETIETDETHSVHSGCSGGGGAGENGTDAQISSTAPPPIMQRSSSTTCAPPLAIRSSSSSAVRSTSMAHNLNQHQRQQLMSAANSSSSSSAAAAAVAAQNLHSAAAAVYNYHVITSEIGHEYLNDIYTEEDEKVYEDLCYVTFSSKVSEITSATSFEQRDYVIRELIDTESNYLDVLNALKMKFMAPLERYLTPDDIRQIFPRIKELADIHTKFLDKLRDSLQPHAKMKMGQVFLEFREPFLIYGEYCSCLLGAIDFLADICKKNQIIEQLVQQCEREYNVGKLQLRDILSVPMQRILKYHLLLDKLVKETSPAHEDYRSLERAKEAMIDVSQYINEVKRDSDHLVIIQKVKDSIVDLHLLQNGNDLLQYGRLLLDGELHIKAHEDQKTKLRYAFVFDKILILVKPAHMKTGDMQYTFRDSHNLAEYQVEQSHSRRTIGRDSRFKYQLLLARKSGKTAFTLYLKSEPERDKWRKALTEAMENLDPPGCRNTDHKMEIFTFDAPTTCRHCSKFLKGRIHQGYRCKVCEIAVHKGCISSTGRCKQNVVAIPPPVCDRQLAQFNWFVGNMDRETAQARLEHRRVGTYLLRVRPQGASNPKETMYALSLKTDDNVIKHMKINQDHSGDSIAYCLSSRRHFKNIVELVSYYERNDLGENFAGLNQSLQWPYREVLATAIYDFEPKGNNQLALKTGCQVLVIGKDGDNKGWWRGKIGDTVGYFPKEYVQEHPPTNDEL
ncbi:vav guanine nucleotide exchange factor isoform X1 [Musca autumnalis]|uniref:vav guanine nucleotide exchange factor isoform X1 n=1 Tax=Musca autumnalis TaxID=221902 RepID=UPI003CEA3FAD